MEKSAPFYCFICDKIIINGEVEYSHFEFHIRYDPFKCLDCGTQYSNKNDLREHLEFFGHLNYQRNTKLKLRKFINLMGLLSNQMKTVDSADIIGIQLIIKKDRENIFKDMESDEPKGKSLNGTNESENETSTKKLKIEIENHNRVETFQYPKPIQSAPMFPVNNVPVTSQNSRVKKSKPQNLVKMRNGGFLDIKMLGINGFIEHYRIKHACDICKKNCYTGKDKIVHVFEKHLMLNDYRFLKCFYCFSKNIHCRNFLDFSSVKEHYRGKQCTHGDKKFKNNLEISYCGNTQFVYLDGNQDILYRYEIEFERCFVMK